MAGATGGGYRPMGLCGVHAPPTTRRIRVESGGVVSAPDRAPAWYLRLLHDRQTGAYPAQTGADPPPNLGRLGSAGGVQRRVQLDEPGRFRLPVPAVRGGLPAPRAPRGAGLRRRFRD